MTDDFPLNRIVAHWQEDNYLRNNTGMISCHRGGILLTPTAFVANVPKPWKTERNTYMIVDHVHAEGQIEGVTFSAVFTVKEWERQDQ